MVLNHLSRDDDLMKLVKAKLHLCSRNLSQLLVMPVLVQKGRYFSKYFKGAAGMGLFVERRLGRKDW